MLIKWLSFRCVTTNRKKSIFRLRWHTKTIPPDKKLFFIELIFVNTLLNNTLIFKSNVCFQYSLFVKNVTELTRKALQIWTVSTKLKKTKPTYLYLLHTNEKQIRERNFTFKNSNKYPIRFKTYVTQFDSHAMLAFLLIMSKYHDLTAFR